MTQGNAELRRAHEQQIESLKQSDVLAVTAALLFSHCSSDFVIAPALEQSHDNQMELLRREMEEQRKQMRALGQTIMESMRGTATAAVTEQTQQQHGNMGQALIQYM